MLFTRLTAAQKRTKFRADLASGRLLAFPGGHAPLVAMEIARQKFDGVYVSGGALAANLGVPDIGLTTLTEVAMIGAQIARVTDLPTIIDGDTGFGEPMSAARTVRLFEESGLAGCHLEDQVNPKRCGHLDGKDVVPRDVAVRRIKAAADARCDSNFLIIARTDARAVEGLDKTIDRIKAYIDAGAEMIFPEALANQAEFEAVRAACSVPILANMTEFGKSKLLTRTELENLGVNLVIYPVTSLRLAMKAVRDGLAAIQTAGTQADILHLMQTRAELYDLLEYEAYNSLDTGLFNFTLGE